VQDHLLARLGLDTRNFDRKLKKAVADSQRADQRMSVSFRGMATAAAGVTAAIAAAAVASGRLAERGSQVSAVQRAFARRVDSTSAAMHSLRDATLGLVSDFDLMVQANTALTLGSAKSVEEVSTLASVATRLGRALGVDALFAFNSLNTGIARQSRLLLDNLGIIVDVDSANRAYAATLDVTAAALTDADRKEAFRIEAMRQASSAADELGDKVTGAGEAWRGFVTELKNTGDALAQRTGESEGLAGVFDGWASALRIARFELGKFLDDAGSSAMRRFATMFQPGGFIGGFPNSSARPRTQPRPRRRPTPAPRVFNVPDPTGSRAGGAPFVGDILGGPPIDPTAIGAPGVQALGIGQNRANTINMIAGMHESIRQAREQTEKWKSAILAVSQTVEHTLVRSLTKAIMRFESISALIKDIAKSLISSVVGGLVSFGIQALTRAALGSVTGGVGAAVPGVTGAIAGFSGLSPSVRGVSGGSLTISSDMIPEPADRGIIASKSQVQQLVVEVIHAARANGANV